MKRALTIGLLTALVYIVTPSTSDAHKIFCPYFKHEGKVMTAEKHFDYFYGMITQELVAKAPQIIDYTLTSDGKIGSIEAKTDNYTISIIDRKRLKLHSDSPTIRIEFASGSLRMWPETRQQNLEVHAQCGKVRKPDVCLEEKDGIYFGYKLPQSAQARKLSDILLGISHFYIGTSSLPELPFVHPVPVSYK